jgi:hypothetical protein
LVGEKHWFGENKALRRKNYADFVNIIYQLHINNKKMLQA